MIRDLHDKELGQTWEDFQDGGSGRSSYLRQSNIRMNLLYTIKKKKILHLQNNE